jgi:hypothetical protein
MTHTITIHDCRPEVIGFAIEMEKKLRENDHKRSWKECDYSYLLDRAVEEMKELEECFWAPDGRSDMIWLGDLAIRKNKTPRDVIGETVDVGNFMMMIMDHIKTDYKDGLE